MYRIDIGAFHPLEFENVADIAQYVEDMNVGIHKQVGLIERNTEHLLIRCSVSGDYLDITADTSEEIDRLHKRLMQRNLYRP